MLIRKEIKLQQDWKGGQCNHYSLNAEYLYLA